MRKPSLEYKSNPQSRPHNPIVARKVVGCRRTLLHTAAVLGMVAKMERGPIPGIDLRPWRNRTPRGRFVEGECQYEANGLDIRRFGRPT